MHITLDLPQMVMVKQVLHIKKDIQVKIDPNVTQISRNTFIHFSINFLQYYGGPYMQPRKTILLPKKEKTKLAPKEIKMSANKK